MPQSVSETSLVTNASPIQLGNSDIVFQDDFGNSDLLDVEGYSCTNRELVNLENAAINVDNSTDVIIGPVTQFNVSGNVTIYQNGQSAHEAINGTTISEEQENDFKTANNAKLSRFEKSESEDQELKNFNKHKKFIKIISAISFVLLILVGITVMLIHYYNTFEENAEYTPAPAEDDNYLGSHQILDRTKWNGRPPVRYRNITSPVPMVIMKHTGGGTCDSFQQCAGKVQTIQSQSVNKGAEDIYYNFLIGGDGNIYVGRGWDVQPHQRDDIIDIAFMGSFVFDELTPTMIEAAKLLIVDGAEMNKLKKDYKIVCHNQTEPTESPGKHVIEEVRKWPHYDPGEYFTHNVLTSQNGN